MTVKQKKTKKTTAQGSSSQKKSSEPKPAKMSHDGLAQYLADWSDTHGMAPEHIRQNPETLTGTGLSVEDFTDGVIDHAVSICREEFREIVKKHGANKPASLPESTQTALDVVHQKADSPSTKRDEEETDPSESRPTSQKEEQPVKSHSKKPISKKTTKKPIKRKEGKEKKVEEKPQQKEKKVNVPLTYQRPTLILGGLSSGKSNGQTSQAKVATKTSQETPVKARKPISKKK